MIDRLLAFDAPGARPLPLADGIVAALLRGEGAEGRNLRIVLAWELGDFTAGDAVTGGRDRVARAYRDAVAWADETATALSPAGAIASM